jgi:Domain of unknown function (DUF4218)
LERLEQSIVLTLCKLEKIFPPSFFDVMVHLASEAKLGGPVQFRWMYPIERSISQQAQLMILICFIKMPIEN